MTWESDAFRDSIGEKISDEMCTVAYQPLAHIATRVSSDGIPYSQKLLSNKTFTKQCKIPFSIHEVYISFAHYLFIYLFIALQHKC